MFLLSILLPISFEAALFLKESRPKMLLCVSERKGSLKLYSVSSTAPPISGTRYHRKAKSPETSFSHCRSRLYARICLCIYASCIVALLSPAFPGTNQLVWNPIFYVAMIDKISGDISFREEPIHVWWISFKTNSIHVRCAFMPKRHCR